jgi:peptide/nickel transport system substrate-binding protein
MFLKRIRPILLAMLLVFSCFSIFAEPKELTLAIGGESTDGYDPTLGWGRYGSTLFHSTLLKRDDNLKIVNDLATSYTISKDCLTWNVKIRNDVKFSDGQPLTAKDVVYTFIKASRSGGKIDMTMLDSVKEKGKFEIEFKLKYPYITFINKLITLGIVPENVHKNNPDYARQPVGSGPYKFINWVEGQQLIVEVNPNYYGTKPAIKKITFLFLNEDTALAAAKSGKVQMIAVPAMLSKQKIEGMTIHPVKSVDNRGICFPVVPDTGKKTVEGYPIGNNVTCNVEIRKAINYIVDRKLMVDTILEGYGTPAYGIVDNLDWDNHEIRIKDNDINTAKKILSDAGWKDTNKDGIVEKNGLKAEFDLVYPSTDSLRQQLALASADMIGKIGIKVNIIGKSWDEIAKINHANAILFGFGSHTPEEMYNIYHSKFAGNGSYNAGFYANKTVDRYFDKAMLSISFEDSLKYWKLAQWDGKTGLSLKGDAPWAWLVNLTHVYFVSNDLDVGVSRMEPHGHGWPITANIEKWKWKK